LPWAFVASNTYRGHISHGQGSKVLSEAGGKSRTHVARDTNLSALARDRSQADMLKKSKKAKKAKKKTSH
jgi:hypothetical protein